MTAGHRTPEDLAADAERLLAELGPRQSSLRPKERTAIPQQAMPAQDPAARRGNTLEVALGYTPAQAAVEALRCLQCKNAPCVKGCPVAIDIPGFIRCVGQGDLAAAAALLKSASLLPAVCGRVCPQETQCMEPCTVGKARGDVMESVAIGRLERFVADWEREQGRGEVPAVKPGTGHKVAVIGSGPAGITVAADVRREGHHVTMFEAFHKPGGVLMYGIPEFRLPKRIVELEIETLRRMGVEIRTNFVVGRTRTVRDLMAKDGFEAVFIGTGAGLPKFMNIEGENLVGVFSANEYLTRANLMRAYDADRADTPIRRARKVAVLGGGNVAMDAARTALRLGAAEVHLVYRRTEKEMPARVEEVHHAREEGVEFHMLQNAKRILGDESGCVTEIECLRYELGEPDASGRRRPVEVSGSEFLMAVDTVIVAIGNDSNPLISQTTPEIKSNKYGNVLVDENNQTSMPRVFAGGDIVLGAATVIRAMGEGRRAAAAINRLLAGG
jgi:glutamate synthase (NADPH/NADH) small chain